MVQVNLRSGKIKGAGRAQHLLFAVPVVMQQAYPTTWKDTIYYFVEDVSTSLRCPIHKGLFNKPVIASCGHTFCQSCILSFLDNSEEPECPIDHSSLKESGCLIPNLAVEGQIQDLYVYCKYSLKMVDNTMVVDPAVCYDHFMYSIILIRPRHATRRSDCPIGRNMKKTATLLLLHALTAMKKSEERILENTTRSAAVVLVHMQKLAAISLGRMEMLENT